ncbi:MAG: ParB/RepB/Spo0J family partition protein [Promethearchaeota archaeon]|jgi:ParB-like chromosome segregation protein Spo0J
MTSLMDQSCIRTGLIKDIKLKDIKVNPQTRIRQHSTDFKNDPHYRALKESMIKFGMLHPLIVDMNSVLIGGFYRFCAATELGWDYVKARIVDVSEFNKILIEIIENYNRKDFSSYEFYIGIGRLKKEYEKNHPETKHGFGRWQNTNISRNRETGKENKEEIVSVLKNDHQSVPSFVKLHYEMLGLTERGLRNKTRIGEAIINNKFSDKTIRLLRIGKITQKKLLSLLKKPQIQKETINLINETHSSKPPKGKKKELNTTGRIDVSIRRSIVDKFVMSGNKHLKSCGKVALTQGSQISNRRIKPEITKNFKIKTYNIKDEEIRKKKTYQKKKEIDEDKCRFCEKATVIAVSCEECGHPTPKVMCDDDITNGISRLRNPYVRKCVNSPDHLF